MHINIFNTTDFLQTAGYLGLFIMIFAETGILIGLVLPGESLLLTAGFLSSIGYFNLWLVILVTFVAAALADSVGYALGHRYGRNIFVRKDSLLFDQQYITRAENFYSQHGGKTVILARFLPFIRTIAPILAGVGRMKYSVFVIYNLIGAILWSTAIGLIGYYLGQRIPNASQHIVILILFIAVISCGPAIWTWVAKAKKLKKD